MGFEAAAVDGPPWRKDELEYCPEAETGAQRPPGNHTTDKAPVVGFRVPAVGDPYEPIGVPRPMFPFVATNPPMALPRNVTLPAGSAPVKQMVAL